MQNKEVEVLHCDCGMYNEYALLVIQREEDKCMYCGKVLKGKMTKVRSNG